MDDVSAKTANIQAPLAALHGASPPAPAWFADALRQAPERSFHDVGGARIEALSWGEIGRPGLLLMHGAGAHADWWSFIAPFLAKDYRVSALSWSGMGGSDWRKAYSLDLYVEEAFTVAEATGLLAAPVKPVFVGHSFGGGPVMASAARRGERLRAAIILDSMVLSPEQRAARAAARKKRESKPTKVYASLEEALARFRFMPPQPCEHLFIADHIARGSLREVDEGGRKGWTWRFDPFIWENYKTSELSAELAAAACPFAILWGGRSALLKTEMIAYVASLVPKGSPLIEIPEANHHVMVDQPLALVAALRALLEGWA